MSDLSGIFVETSQLMCRLWQAVDQRRYAQATALFTKEGRWERDGAWQTGEDAIMKSLERRPKDLFSRHVLSNFMVDETGHGSSCDYCILAFGDLSPPTDRPRTPGPPAAIVDAKGRCVREGGVLRIAELAMMVAFFAVPPAK